MTDEELKTQLEEQYKKGFENGYNVLLNLIQHYTDSRLKPIEYIFSSMPKLPHHCLAKYFAIIDKDWQVK